MTESEEILQKLQVFCAGRERCTSEVMTKLTTLGLDKEIVEAIILSLKKQKFLDDRRYCFNFVRQAFEEKQKGRMRIHEELKIRGIDEDLIEVALQTISKEEFNTLLLKKLTKETRNMNPEKISLNSGKIMRKLVRDGFEEDEIVTIFRKNFNVDILI